MTELNEAIRDRLVAAGAVNDTRAMTTNAGERIGVGDTMATRRNNRDLDVANRDTWTVTATHPDGQLTVTSPTAGERVLPADYVREHVELAYATTAYGAQGATATAAHLIVGEHTSAATAYVGMTRGRQANIAHLIAGDPDEAREQWVATFGRDRADLGPEHARGAAEAAAAQYAPPRSVDDLIAALCREWDSEANDVNTLAWAVPLRDDLSRIAQLQRDQADKLAPLEARYRLARETRTLVTDRAEQIHAIVAAEVEHDREALLTTWATQRPEAQANARTVLDGPGRLGLRWPAVNRANEALARWAIEWQPIIPAMPTGHSEIARFADRADDTPRFYAAMDDHARRQAAARHPEHERHIAQAAAADRDVNKALGEFLVARGRHQRELGYYGRLGATEDPGKRLAQVERRIATTEQRLGNTPARIAHLEKGIASAGNSGGQAAPVRLDISRLEPADAVLAPRRDWFIERDAEQQAARIRSAHRVAKADGPAQHQDESWRRHELGFSPAVPDDGIER